jgi:hypothetical protein
VKLLDKQASFSGGELAPALWARDDIQQYRYGLRKAKNFFITRHGAAVSRPGFSFVAETDGTEPILVPYYYSDQMAFILEFNVSRAAPRGFIQIYKNGKRLQSGGGFGSGAPFRLTNPLTYITGTNFKLKWSQQGRFLYLTSGDEGSLHPSAVWRISKNNDIESSTAWSIVELKFDLVPYRGTRPMFRSPRPTEDVPKGFFKKEWSWYVSQVCQRLSDGSFFETKAKKVTEEWIALNNNKPPPDDRTVTDIPDDMHVVYNAAGKAMEVTWPQYVNNKYGSSAELNNVDYVVKTARIYRGRGFLKGLVGEESWDKGSFIDYGEEPNYNSPPPEGENPFILNKKTEVPTAVAFFQQRLVLGNTKLRPNALWFSAVDDFENFDRRYLPIPEAAVLDVRLAAKRAEFIRHIFGVEKLLVFTDSSVWVVGPRDGAISIQNLPETRFQTDVGSANNPAPLNLEEAILYVRSKGNGVRDLFYDERHGSFIGGDISFLAQHFLENYTITSWCYAEDPYAVIWMTRNDGKLISLTYSKALNIAAWCLHDTDGEFLSVASIPEGDEDRVYAVVKRGLRRFVERLAPCRMVSDVKDAMCLDSAVSYSGAPTTTISGLDHLASKQVFCNADGNKVGPLTVSGAGQVALPFAASKVHVGLKYTPELELLDSLEAREKRKLVKWVTWEVEASRGIWTGENSDSLVEWKQRRTGDDWGPVPLETGRVRISIKSKWGEHGRAMLRQEDPFPLRVLGAIREGAEGE